MIDMTKKVMIIVDVQNDFVEGGALGVEGGNQVASNIIKLLSAEHDYAFVVTTQDWHIKPKGHFSDKPDFIDTWPVHCVAETKGAEITKPLKEFLESTKSPVSIPLKKGEYEAAYSGFEAYTEGAGSESLNDLLKYYDVTDVDIVGIATDYCVKATAEDAVKNGFNTTIIKDAVAGIHPDQVETLLSETFPNNHITIR